MSGCPLPMVGSLVVLVVASSFATCSAVTTPTAVTAGPHVFLSYQFNGDFTHSTVASLNGSSVTDLVDIKPEPTSFTCCTSKGVAFWSGGPQEQQLGYLDVHTHKVSLSSWSLDACCPPQLGPMVYYDTFGQDDVFLVARSKNFPHGTWALQKLNATDGTLSDWYEFPKQFVGNTFTDMARAGDTLTALFSTDTGSAMVAVDISYQGPSGKVVYSGPKDINNIAMGPSPTGVGNVQWSTIVCGAEQQCVVYVNPETGGLVPVGLPLNLPNTTFIRDVAFDAFSSSLLLAYSMDYETMPNAPIITAVNLADGGRTTTTYGPLYDDQCLPTSENGCWIGEVFSAF